MAKSPLIPLFAIFVAAWLLVLGGAVIVFHLIVPFSFCHCFYDGVAKGVFATILAVIWLAAMVAMRDYLVRKSIFNKERKKAIAE